MKSVTLDSVPSLKRYIPTVAWSLGSAFAFAGLGLMGGMSWALVPPVVLAFGFLHMSIMTKMFLTDPATKLTQLSAAEKLAQALLKLKTQHMNATIGKLVPSFYDLDQKEIIRGLIDCVHTIQDPILNNEDKTKAQTKFALTLLQLDTAPTDIETFFKKPSLQEKVIKPANLTESFLLGLAGYIYATMLFIQWALLKIYTPAAEYSGSSSEIAPIPNTYKYIGTVGGAAFFFPFLAFVFGVLPDQGSELWKMFRHSKQSFQERSLALRQWPYVMFPLQAFFWTLLIPSTASMNYLNDQFLDGIPAFSESALTFFSLWLILQLASYPMTFIFNSLGISPATSLIADNLTAIPACRNSTKQDHQKVKENAVRLAEFESTETPAAYLIHLNNIRNTTTPENLEAYCKTKFKMDNPKQFVARFFQEQQVRVQPATENTALNAEDPAVEEVPQIEALKQADTWSQLIDTSAQQLNANVIAKITATEVDAAIEHGLFGGKTYKGFGPEPDARRTPRCSIM